MAGRIPQSFIDDLLDRVDIVEIIDSRVPLKKSGKNYTACCPFHDEKTPSFSVSPDKQFYYCFGCGASGSALGFLLEYEGLPFPEAVEVLAQTQGLEVPREETAENPQRRDIYALLDSASHYYQEQLRSHPSAEEATDYLKKRGLSGQVAHRFAIGYAPAGWDNLLKFLGRDEGARERLLKAGLVINNEEKQRLYDRFRQRIMFPIRDVRGRVVAFGGRVLGDEKPKYLNSPETEVFHKGRELYGLYEANRANRHLERLLVVEGYMDVVALAQHDIDFAVATLGTAAGTAHLDKAFRYSGEIVFCFDGDDAGRKAAERALEAALPVLTEGRQVRFMFLPEGEDPDSLVQKEGNEHFLAEIDQAMPLSEYLFELGGQGCDLGTAEGRAALVSRLKPLIGQVPEGVYKEQLKKLLATQSQVSLTSLEESLQSVQVSADLQPRPPPLTGPDTEPVQKNRHVPRFKRVNLYDEAASLLLQQTGLIDACEALDLPGLENSSLPEAKRLACLIQLVKDAPGASLNKIMGLWQSQYGAEQSEALYHLAAKEWLLDQAALEQQFRDILGKIQRDQAEQPLQYLIEKARLGLISGEEKQELNRLLLEKGSSAP